MQKVLGRKDKVGGHSCNLGRWGNGAVRQCMRAGVACVLATHCAQHVA